MKIIKYKNSEKGFAIALALLMLLVMSLMGATLVMVVGSDHKKNAIKDSSQQAFYAAETGITEAKKWLADPKNSPLKSQSDPSSNLKFCKTSLFSNLSSVIAINNADSGVYVGRKRLDEIITVSGDEKERLKKYSYEFFITYTPDQDGGTETKREKSITASTGSSIAEGASYKTSGTNKGVRYTIFSCGCNDVRNNCKQGEDIVAKLLADVILVE